MTTIESDYLLVGAGAMRLAFADTLLTTWIRDCRLDGFAKVIGSVSPEDTARMAVLQQLRPTAMAAMANLQGLAG